MPAGVRPVEQMVDAAIERIAREQGLSRQLEREQRGLERDRGLAQPGLVKASSQTFPTRLRWKGLDVSEEFREYAERVANGEDLPPFEGRVLAEPNAEFPWGAPPPRQHDASTSKGPKLALLSSAVFAVGLLAWAFMPRGEAERGALIEPVPAPTSGLTTAPAPVAAADVPVAEVATEEAPVADPASTPEVATAALLPAPADPPSVDAVAAAMHSSVAPPASEVSPSPLPELAATSVTPPAAATSAASRPPQKAVAPVASVPSAPAAAKSVSEDDFGIMQLDEPRAATASSASTPAVPAAKTVAPAGASVGDLARAGQGPAGAVRKEPGSESSAKGSLLVETPSF